MKTYLYVTPFFPTPSNWRGAYGYDFVKALQRALEANGQCEGEQWKVLVFKPGDGKDYEIGGVKVHTFKARHLPSNILPFLFKRQNQKSFLKKVETIICSTFNLQPSACFDSVEVCHGNTATFAIYPLAVKRLNAKCKTLLHHHDLASFGLNMGRLRHCWLYNFYMFPVLRKLHEAIDAHVFISEASRKSFLMAPDTSWTIFEDYKKQMRGLPYRSAKIRDSIILHNGVDKSIFNVEGRVKSVDRGVEGEFVIGCVGNFDDGKDQMTLLLAVAILKLEGRMLRVRFVGSGPYLEECKQYAKKHNIDAEFLTEMRHEQLPKFYRSLDLFVLPSYFEGFGCVFAEAHSSGVPFITCEGQGVDDILEVRSKSLECRVDNPWLCKPRDVDGLAKKIADAIDKMKARGEGEGRKDINLIQPLTEDQSIDKLVEKFVEQVVL